MKWKIALLTAVVLSASSSLNAQRGGVPGLGRTTAGRTARMRHGAGFFHETETRWNNHGRFGESGRYSDYGWSSCYLCDGWYGDYGSYWGAGYGLQPATIVVAPVLQAAEPAPPLLPPPPPASPALHEYSWPDSGGDSGSAFVIVSKDGTVQRAIAVWAQDNRICFVTPEGISRFVPLNDLDRPSTNRLNAEMNLKLALPVQDSAEPQPAN